MIKALSGYLGHSSAAFTLKTCTHLMPSSEDRTKAAVDAVSERLRNRIRRAEGGNLRALPTTKDPNGTNPS